MPDALASPVELGVATLALPGEDQSGDLHVFARFGGGFLVAAIDGLGHGPEANAAATSAAQVLESRAGGDVVSLIEACNRELGRTRGAVMTVATFDIARSEMSWLGVGNIEGVLVRHDSEEQRSRESVMLMGGIVGHHLPVLRPSSVEIMPGDTVVFASDGIRNSFLADLDPRGDVQAAANAILETHRKGTDDALVVVARYLGG